MVVFSRVTMLRNSDFAKGKPEVCFSMVMSISQGQLKATEQIVYRTKERKCMFKMHCGANVLCIMQDKSIYLYLIRFPFVRCSVFALIFEN